MKILVSILLIVLLPLQAVASAVNIGCAHADEGVAGIATLQMHGEHSMSADVAREMATDTSASGRADDAVCTDHCAHCHLAVVGLFVSDSTLAAPPLASRTFALYREALLSTSIAVPERVPLST